MKSTLLTLRSLVLQTRLAICRKSDGEDMFASPVVNVSLHDHGCIFHGVRAHVRHNMLHMQPIKVVLCHTGVLC